MIDRVWDNNNMQPQQCLELREPIPIILAILRKLPSDTAHLCKSFSFSREHCLRLLAKNPYVIPPFDPDAENQLSHWVASSLGQMFLDDEQRVRDAKFQKNEYMFEPKLSAKVARMQEQLSTCSLKHMLHVRHNRKGELLLDDDGRPIVVDVMEHCNHRSCKRCTDHRIGQVKDRVRPYFELVNFVSHVTLTIRNLDYVDKEVIRRERIKVKKFFRMLNRGRGRKFYGMHAIEIKYQFATGDWHIHWHAFFFNGCPHHLRVAKLWEKVQGAKLQVRVKYYSHNSVKNTMGVKMRMLDYFAELVANAGFIKEGKELVSPLPDETYLELIHKTRLYTKFGSYPQGLDAAVASILEQLATKEHELEEEWPKVYVTTETFNPDGKKPPPDFQEIVIKELAKHPDFSVSEQEIGYKGSKPLFKSDKPAPQVFRFTGQDDAQSSWQSYSPELAASPCEQCGQPFTHGRHTVKELCSECRGSDAGDGFYARLSIWRNSEFRNKTVPESWARDKLRMSEPEIDRALEQGLVFRPSPAMLRVV